MLVNYHVIKQINTERTSHAHTQTVIKSIMESVDEDEEENIMLNWRLLAKKKKKKYKAKIYSGNKEGGKEKVMNWIKKSKKKYFNGRRKN